MIFLLSKGHWKVLTVLAFSGSYYKLLTDKNILLGASYANFEGILHGITFLAVIKRLKTETFNLLKAMIRIAYDHDFLQVKSPTH